MQQAKTSDSVLGQVKGLLLLAGPLIVNNLASAGMGFADTVMAGRIGTADLAAVALGSSVFMVVFLFGFGVLTAMSPTAAHAYGAGRNREVGVYFRQCLWLSQALAVLGVVTLQHADQLLRGIGVDPAVVPLTVRYLDAIAWGLPGMFAYLSIRLVSEGIGWTRPIMYVAAVGLVVNVLGNWVLMYGKFGLPALGAVGCGVASAIAMWVMFATMVAYVARHPRYRDFELASSLDPPSWPRLRELLSLGLPISVSFVSEAGLFSAVGLLMGTLGAAVVAAHQIAINYAATMFMIPLGLHSALTIRVGHALGRGEPELARRVGIIGIAMCGVVMVVSALVLLLFRGPIAAFYTVDAEVRGIAISLLTMGMIFQISDGLQVGAAGALRGYKDTRIPMLLNFGSYWLVAFPMAWYAGVIARMGPQAVWVGLIVGLTLTALTLGARFALVSGRRLARPV